jgi:superfamily II DNA helicase RecQ
VCPDHESAKKLARELEREQRENEDLTKHVQKLSNAGLDPGLDRRLDKARKSLGYPPLKHTQELVCKEAISSKNDIIFQAPCGFGKSACFTVPAKVTGGITVVLEPFKALIESQLDSLKGLTSIRVEKLLTNDEACRINGEGGKQLPAKQRLLHLAQSYSHENNPKPIIIFGIVELVLLEDSLRALSILSKQGILKRIVVDEFDVLEDSRAKYREAYFYIMPKLRKYCRSPDGRPIQIMCLSATVTKYTIISSRESADVSSKATLFLSDRALPDWHTYSVERKVSNSQVSGLVLERFYSIITNLFLLRSRLASIESSKIITPPRIRRQRAYASV